MRTFKIKINSDLLWVELPIADTRTDGTMLKRHAIRAALQHAIKRVLDSRPSTLMVVPEGTTSKVDGRLSNTRLIACWTAARMA